MAEFEIHLGDITKLNVDAIVNAANTSLLGGGGVDGAIHRAAGPQLLEECRKLGGCAAGEARITKGYNLQAKYVIHAVGPIWEGGRGNEEALLQHCYVRSLKLASDHKLSSIAFPCISTGVHHFPRELAAGIAIATVKESLRMAPTVSKVIFACFSQEDATVYKALLNSEV